MRLSTLVSILSNRWTSFAILEEILTLSLRARDLLVPCEEPEPEPEPETLRWRVVKFILFLAGLGGRCDAEFWIGVDG